MRLLLLGLILFASIDAFGQKSGNGELVGVNPKIRVLNPKKDVPKQWQLFFGDLVFIPAGDAVVGSMFYMDSLISMKKRQVSVGAFYMSSTEVTNWQYRSFCNNIQKEFGKDSAQKLLPDTTCWNKLGGDTGPMVTYYFSHPAYDNYPVVGVSYTQAMAYVNWLNNHLQNNTELQSMTTKSGLLGVSLPSEIEWEYAARGGHSDRMLYPWSGGYYQMRKDSKGFMPMANGGSIKDETGFTAFDWGYDGAFYTSKVKSYPSNDFGLFDMGGNVNEWVLDDYIADEVTEDLSNKPRWYKDDDARGIIKVPSKVIKGGSYLDAPYYLTLGSRRPMEPKEQRPDLGFRIIVTIANLNPPKAY
jgi:formylglycine-generating enzyme